MATLIGRVGMVAKGAWDSNIAYDIMDVVTYNNSTYIAKQASPAGTLPTNTTYWQLALDASQLQPKEAGKGLSTNDYDNTAKGIVDNTPSNLASKADKVSGATSGNLAGLDANGNLTDSGIAAEYLLRNNIGSAISITNQTSYTTTADGYFVVTVALGNDNYAYMQVNGVTFATVVGISNASLAAPSGTLFVRKGSAITMITAGGTGYFYPLVP